MKTELFHQILDEASFFWFQRNHAAESPFFNLTNLIQLDRRLAGLFRLLPSYENFEDELNKEFDIDNKDDFFCLLIAAASNKKIDITPKVADAVSNGADIKDIVSTIGWISFEIAEPLLFELWESDSNMLKAIAIEGWRFHRVKPPFDLSAPIDSEDINLSCAAIRLAGDLGLQDFVYLIEGKLASPDNQVRFWACYSSVLLGNPKALSNLIEAINPDNDKRYLAINTVFPAMDYTHAISWINHLSSNKCDPEFIIKAFEVLGTTKYLPWLISLIKSKETSAFATHAFCTITGMTLSLDNYGDILPLLADHSAYETDEFEDIISQIPFESINEWWKQHQNNFLADQRYFLAKDMHEKNLNFILKEGSQTQRERAALELAILSPQSPVFEHRAPGFRQ
ncbi:MAG: hypothetical protein D6B28_02780 [Gammaproteobacteria bacterium]|nr:MAG: hypothetical protein D6B28_02780 [Gammaproteobacteria bacterium]